MSQDQAQNDQLALISTVLQSLTQLVGPSRPAIVPGAIYTSSQLEANLGISSNTTTLWLDHELKFYRPGTRQNLFLGDEVIEFIKQHPRLARPVNYQQKLDQRKKGRTK